MVDLLIAIVGLGLPVVLVSVAGGVWIYRRLINRPADSFMILRLPEDE